VLDLGCALEKGALLQMDAFATGCSHAWASQSKRTLMRGT
jgi:hypothetical protein